MKYKQKSIVHKSRKNTNDQINDSWNQLISYWKSNNENINQSERNNNQKVKQNISIVDLPIFYHTDKDKINSKENNNQIKNETKSERLIHSEFRNNFTKAISIDDKLKAIELCEKGVSVVEIASMLNTLTSNIKYWMKNKDKLISKRMYAKRMQNVKLNFTTNDLGKFFKLHEKLEAIQMCESGILMVDVAFLYNTKPSNIQYWIKNKEKIVASINNKEELKNMNIISTSEGDTRKISKVDKLRAVDMYKLGNSLVDVASRFNASPGTISYWIKNANKSEHCLTNERKLLNEDDEIKENIKKMKFDEDIMSLMEKSDTSLSL